MAITLDELNGHIEEYVRSISIHDPEDEFLNQWILVFNTGSMSSMITARYGVEAYPPNMPPHHIKGLIMEGDNCFEALWNSQCNDGECTCDE